MASPGNLSIVPSIPNCSVAQSIVPNLHYQVAVIIESVCGIYAFVANVLLLVVGWRVMVFPANLRILLGHLSFILAWYGLGGAVKGAYLLGSPVCDLVITSRNCRILEMMCTNLGIPNMVVTLSAVWIERLYATIRYRRYDRPGVRQVPCVAISSLFVIWGAALGFNVYPLIVTPPNSYTSICEGSVFAPRSALAPYYILYLVLEVLAVFATVFIYFFNRHMLKSMVINRALYDLSSRFSVDQNVQVNAVLMPSMILHLLCFLPNYALLLLFFDFDIPTKATLLHISYLWKQVYAGVHPTLAFALNKRLKQQLYQNVIGRLLAVIGLKWERSPKTTDVNMRSRQEGDAHFKHLEDLWSGQKPLPAAPLIKVIRYRGYITETSL